MDPSQLSYLSNLLKGGGMGSGTPGAQPPAPQPPTPNSAFMGAPGAAMPQGYGGSPQAPNPLMGAPQGFMGQRPPGSMAPSGMMAPPPGGGMMGGMPQGGMPQMVGMMPQGGGQPQSNFNNLAAMNQMVNRPSGM